MTISTFFNEELQGVDAGKVFTFDNAAAGHGTNEFSVNGWIVSGGSDAACSQGASEALYAIGFRFYDPMTSIYPASVPTNGVTIAKTQHIMPYIKVYENYGRGGQRETEWDRWVTLNCADDGRRPVGHMWGTIHNRMASYFAANPAHWLQPHVVGQSSNPNGAFDLDLTGAERQQLVDAIAADILANGLNEENRHAFDPQDGDLWSTDKVVDFANEVVTKIRETVPDAKLGIYAYANHRAAPTSDCPYLYVQIALGFNDLGIGYQEMVRQWSLKAGEVALRGYGDIAAQSGWMPSNSKIEQSTSFTAVYPGYISNGADSLNMETSGHFCKNAIGHYHMIRFCKDGVTSYADVLSEYVMNVFNDDPKAAELFTYWGDPTTVCNAFLLSKSFDMIDALLDGPRKTILKQYITLMWRHWMLTENGGGSDGAFQTAWSQGWKNTYFTKLERCARWAWWLGEQGQFHAYGYVRQQCNANVTNNGRADLAFSGTPHWQTNPEAPTDADFDQARLEANNAAIRPAQLEFQADLSDLVVVDTIPEGYAATNTSEGVDFHTAEVVADFIAVGPTTITVNYVQAFNSPTGIALHEFVFGEGMHRFNVSGEAYTSHVGGLLFLNGFPRTRLEASESPNSGKPRWMYFPKIVQGALRVLAGSRLSVYHKDSATRLDISGAAPQNIAPGVARVDGVNTRGHISLLNCAPFLSLTPYKMLMPRALAEVEFPAGVRIGVK